MTLSTIVIAIIGIAIIVNLYLITRPASTRGPAGKILAFIAIFVLPIVVVAFGTQEHLEGAKTTKFCLSCHPMEQYGKSLLVDDNEFIPAVHYQNNRIPREMACYTCHTEYTMYGDMASKLRGLKHVWVQYFGTVPDSIHLYEKYSNRECLHCHAGARSFESVGAHEPDKATKDSIMTDKKSCVSSGCHDVVHNVHALKDYELWNPDSTKAKEASNGTTN
jgi:nitrate/TMAO reductase-like tetraheme cytochrome c subunit